MARKVIAGVAALVLAVVGTVVLVTYVQSAEERALEGQEVVEVLVVDEAVAEGTPSEQLAELVRSDEIPRAVVAEGAVGSLDDLTGQVAAADLVPGEQVVQSRFGDPDDVAEQSDVDIPEGMQVVSVELAPERVVGGQLRPGDTAGVLASFTGVDVPDPDDPDEVTEQESTTGFIGHKVLVVNVQGEPTPAQQAPEEGEAANPNSDGDGGQDRPAQPPSNLMVSFAVDAADAEKFVFAAEYGQLWLTLEPDDADEDGTQVQTRESIYQ